MKTSNEIRVTKFKIMLDIKFIRENIALIQEGAKKKQIDFDVNLLIEIDDKRKAISQDLEEKKAKQNKASEEIAKFGQAGNIAEKRRLIEETLPLKEKIQKKEEELKEVMTEWQKLMVTVPNIPDMSVPEGSDEESNQEIKKVGQIPEFSFTPKDHIDLMLALGMIDLERGAKVAGFRGYFLIGDGAKLQFALWQFVNDFFQNKKKDFVPMIVPSLLRREPFIGTGYLPQFEEDLYKTQDGEYLSGTAEVAVMNYFSDEMLEKEVLPKKYVAFSPCFRREAGSHGKDTKGLMRVHEFFKIEQVVLCEANHEISVEHHEELTANAEALMQKLEIPYRVVLNCGGDLGLGQVKKYDIEAWVPSENTYRETHSASYFHDFQTRRLNIRYKDETGNTQYAHSLNNTAIATPRVLVSLVENFQTADGSVKIPEVLVPYMNGLREIRTK